MNVLNIYIPENRDVDVSSTELRFFPLCMLDSWRRAGRLGGRSPRRARRRPPRGQSLSAAMTFVERPSEAVCTPGWCSERPQVEPGEQAKAAPTPRHVRPYSGEPTTASLASQTGEFHAVWSKRRCRMRAVQINGPPRPLSQRGVDAPDVVSGDAVVETTIRRKVRGARR